MGRIIVIEALMTTNAKPEFETPRVLHDSPLRSDDKHHFHFDQFAATLSRLIASKTTRTPLTIGVSGSWGSGKTTLLQRVRQQLDAAGNLSDATKRIYWGDNESPQEKFRSCKTVWFDAWKYSNEEHLLAALIRVILATMASGGLGDKFWSKVLDKSYPRRDVVATFLSFFNFKADDTSVEFDINKFKTDTPFAQNTAFFDFFDDALDELLARWVHDTGDLKKIDESKGALVIFIDDLDRCLPDKVVQVLETIKLFLDKQGCIFVIGADANVVREAVTSHYQNIHLTGESASDYLEKIIQLRFELPPILTDQMGDFLQNDAEAKLAVDDEVRRHWSVLVTGAEINPRKVKTFINDVNLQWAMLKNSGQAQGINRDDFTRWQVLMRAAPPNFVERVKAIDDVEIRHKFIADALRWAQGEATLDATFQDYARSLRLRRTLKEIKAFDAQFTPTALEAFIHLTAMPAPAVSTPTVKETPVVEAATPESLDTAQPIETDRPFAKDIRVRDVTREPKPPAVNTQTWGGLEFVRVPAGKFLMGSKDDNKLAQDNERPQHTVDLPYDYWLAKYPVTNDHFVRFVETTQYVTLAETDGGWSRERREYVTGFDWRHPLGPKSDIKMKGDHPVVQVSWHDSMAYCRWLDDTLRAELKNLTLRLPMEAEWEKAARGEYGNEWPWGNEFDPGKCNSGESGKKVTTSVEAYSPQGDSPYGAVDMAGNVWEWCQSLFKAYPYQVSDGRESLIDSGSRVLRGGAFGSSERRVRCSCRYGFDPLNRYSDIGFRLVAVPFAAGL